MAIQVLSVVDAYTRECWPWKWIRALPGRMTRVLDGIVAERGQPLAIRCEQRAGANESTLSRMVCGAADRVDGHSAGKADVECTRGEFSRAAAGRVSGSELVSKPVRCAGKTAAWRKEYNEERPHSSLGYRTPKEFAAQAESFSRAELGQEASNAGPWLRTPIPAQTGDGTEKVCCILT
jgi:putative transposase